MFVALLPLLIGVNEDIGHIIVVPSQMSCSRFQAKRIWLGNRDYKFLYLCQGFNLYRPVCGLSGPFDTFNWSATTTPLRLKNIQQGSQCLCSDSEKKTFFVGFLAGYFPFDCLIKVNRSIICQTLCLLVSCKSSL